MIKIQKISKAIVLFLAVTAMVSCSDDGGTEAFTVIGDVFTTKRMINAEVQYARSYYAYGNQPMSAAELTTPDAMEITLSAVDDIENTWAKQANTNDFSTDFPTEGNYQFDVLHQDVPHEAFDILNFNDMDFSTITSTIMINSALTVEWDGSVESDSHRILLLNQDDIVIFASQFLPSQATKIIIDPNTASGKWLAGYPQPGDTYKLELNAFLFDSDATDLDYNYNIEEIVISEDEIVWE